MIYITGDVHGVQGLMCRLNTDAFYEQKQFDYNHKDENIVIILGDFGCIWANNPQNHVFHQIILPGKRGETKQEANALNWLQDKPFTTIFVDGNHDNHPRINTYPVISWHGGNVHEIRPNVFHLIRGEIYEIEGKTFFAFGGAASHDIQDGILNPADFETYEDFKKEWKTWYDMQRMYRINGYSWWKEELPTKEEMQSGINHLEKHHWKVDYVLSHCCSTSTLHLLDSGHHFYQPDILTDYFEEIRSKLDYQKWLFGHFHNNIQINSQDICLFEQIQPLLISKEQMYETLFSDQEIEEIE